MVRVRIRVGFSFSGAKLRRSVAVWLIRDESNIVDSVIVSLFEPR